MTLFRNEACNASNKFIMCPDCKKLCGYWELADKCIPFKAAHMFDNFGTVLFAVFMALWGLCI